MKFTERELQLLLTLITNEAMTTSDLQQRLMLESTRDAGVEAYLEELRILMQRVVDAIETGAWAVGDEPPIHTLDPNEAEEEPYEPTQADLDSLDAYFTDEGLLE